MEKRLNLTENSYFNLQMTALKSANKELKGMMKTVQIQDIDVTFNILVFISLSLVVNPYPMLYRICKMR